MLEFWKRCYVAPSALLVLVAACVVNAARVQYTSKETLASNSSDVDEFSNNISSAHPWAWRAKNVKSLGKGSFGEVKLLEFPGPLMLAMKKQHGRKRDIDREYFLQELAAKSCLLSVAVVFSHWEGSTNYALLEAGFGGSLESWVKSNFRHGLAEVDGGLLAQLVFAQIVLATKRIHHVGITHADMKPANMIVKNEACKNMKTAKCKSSSSPCTFSQKWIDNKCAVKLADYGLSCVDRDARDGLPKMHGCTNSRAGTPILMAPEVFAARTKTTAVDVWALGGILYYILYAKHMFLNEKTGKLMEWDIKHSPFFTNCNWPAAPKGWQIYRVCVGSIWRGDIWKRSTAERLWQLPYVSEVHAYALRAEAAEVNAEGHGKDYAPPDVVTAPFKSWFSIPGFHAASWNPFSQ